MMASSSIPVKDAEGEKPKVPNWLNLPRDITANILGRLSTIYMVTSVCLVCPLWWNICKDPHIWRTIHISYFETYYRRYINYFDEILRYAVDRSCGHLEDIVIDTFCSDELLEYIAENASNLRCLRLEECRRISEKGFIEAVRKLPLLEEKQCLDYAVLISTETGSQILGFLQFLTDVLFLNILTLNEVCILI
ncbi:F-box protein skip19 [Trifolium pratense]|uniref:F-box protein skip19 n=1 Tax=Trifolium pratense TaxID=57577 RepID=A0A2K3M4P1_TRIPR|nr:F-box protein skip19 [Trifolium pratense]